MEKGSYKQIIQFIEKKIKNGEWTVGTKLPSQRKLAEDFQVNRSTVIHALEILKEKELISSQTGSGSFVSCSSNNTVNWEDFSQYNVYPSNFEIVSKVNKLEIDASLVQLGKGELHRGLFPKELFNESIDSLKTNYDQYGYEDGKGEKRFKEAISNYLKSRGMNYSQECILPVSGGLQALQLITLGLLQNGSTVYANQTSYIHSLKLLKFAGMKVKGVISRNEGIDLQALGNHLNQNIHSSILYLNPTFHNPTTVSMGLEKKKELVLLSNEYKLPIIEDDVFRDLWIDEVPPPTLSSLDEHGNTIYIGSFSKTIAPTLRIGWIAATSSVIEKLSNLKTQIDYGTSYLPQLIIYHFRKWELRRTFKAFKSSFERKKRFNVEVFREIFIRCSYLEYP